MNDKTREVTVQALLDGALGIGGVLTGYALYASDGVPQLAHGGRTPFQNPFVGLVDDTVYSQVMERPEGLFVPIELPCVLMGVTGDKLDPDGWGETDVVVLAWMNGVPGMHGDLAGFHVTSNLRVAQNIYAGADANHGQNPDDSYGGRFIFGPPYRAKADQGFKSSMSRYVLCTGAHLGDERFVRVDLPFIVKDAARKSWGPLLIGPTTERPRQVAS